jgi:class 3 adenylate cyclase
VLVTDAVVGATTDLTVTFVDLGPTELRGLQRPIRLHRAGRGQE